MKDQLKAALAALVDQYWAEAMEYEDEETINNRDIERRVDDFLIYQAEARNLVDKYL